MKGAKWWESVGEWLSDSERMTPRLGPLKKKFIKKHRNKTAHRVIFCDS